jgi:streptogramin lyase
MRSPLIILATAAALAAAAAPAVAAPAVDGEFDLSGSPGRLAAGPDGKMWVLLSSGDNEIASLAADGTVQGFDVPVLSAGVGITAGPGGSMWVTRNGKLVRFDPAAPDQAEEFTVNQIQQPTDIVAGPDGKLWTASGEDVLRVDPASPTTPDEFTVPGLSANGIAISGDKVWVAGGNAKVVVSMGLDGVADDPIDVGQDGDNGGPQGIAAGPGGQVAYTNPGAQAHRLGRLGGPAQGLTPTGQVDPFGIAFGTDGAYWVANFNSTTIGRLTPEGQYTTLDGFSAGPRRIAAGPGNTLWVSLEQADKIARVSGVVAPAPPAQPPAQPPTGGDTQAPAVSGLAVAKRTLKLTLSEAGTIKVRIDRRRAKAAGGKRWRVVRVRTSAGVAGENAVKLGKLRKGRYRVVVKVKDAAGNRSAPHKLGFRRR